MGGGAATVPSLSEMMQWPRMAFGSVWKFWQVRGSEWGRGQPECTTLLDQDEAGM